MTIIIFTIGDITNRFFLQCMALGGGSNVDKTIMHGRFWPVGSVQFGNVAVAAKALDWPVRLPPLIISTVSATKKKTRPSENCLSIMVVLLLTTHCNT